MNIVAMAASNSSKSINHKLIVHAADLLRSGEIDGLGGVDVEVLDLNDFEMPIYSTDREEAGGVPDQAKLFYAKIGEADGLLISFAEHNGNYTAAYKNLFDWASRIDMRVYQDKPTVLLSTSAGPGGGANVLQIAVGSAPFFGTDVRASLSIPSFHENFDPASGTVGNPELDAELRATLASLAAPADNEG